MQTRLRAVLVSMLALSLGGCPPMAPPDQNDPQRDLQPPDLFDAASEPFVIDVQAARTVGPPGTTFTLRANLPPGRSADAISWQVNNADSFADTTETQLTLAEAGSYVIDVEVRDTDGQTARGGLVLQVYATPDSATSTRAITPTRGTAGSMVQISSPLLDDPESTVAIMIDGTPTPTPFRPRAGVANFLIPFEATDERTEESTVDVSLQVNGEVVDTLAFTLTPPATLFADPGAVAASLLRDLPTTIRQAESDLGGFVARADADINPTEQALLQAMLQFSAARINQVETALQDLLAQLPEEEKRRLDQVLLANGVDAELLANLTDQAKSIRQNRNDQLIDDLCRFQDALEQVKRALEALKVAAQVLNTYGLLTAGTPSGPLLLSVSKLLGELTQALSMIVLVADLVPQVLDELRVVASPGTLIGENEKATVQVFAQLTPTDLCARGTAAANLVEFLTNAFAQQATNELFQFIATPGMARELYRHTYRIGRTDPTAATDAMQQIQAYLAGLVGSLIQANVDTNILNAQFQPLLAKLCSIRERDRVPLQPLASVLTIEPANGGRFLNLQDESVDFFCDINRTGAVTLRATRTCGRRTLRGETRVVCGLEPCTENASPYLLVEVIPTMQFDLPNTSCRNLSETLRRVDATISVTNTHPDRTIRVASALYRTSDQRMLTRGACEAGNLLEGETVSACEARVGAGCDGGFGVFLEPGEQSQSIAYVCSQELVYLDPDGDGTCGAAVIETVRENWILQAVFCDNLENEDNFCSQVDPQLKRFGLPGNAGAWTPVERIGCP